MTKRNIPKSRLVRSAVALAVAAALQCAPTFAQTVGGPVRNPVTNLDETIKQIFASGSMVLTEENNVIWIGTTAVNSVFPDPDNATGETFNVTVRSQVTIGTPPRVIGLVVEDNRTPPQTKTINLVRDPGTLGGTAGAPQVPGGVIPVTVPPGNNTYANPFRGYTGSGGDNGWGVRICIIECWTIGENAESGSPGQNGDDFTDVVNKPNISVSSDDLPGVWVSSIGGNGGEGGDAVISLGIDGAQGGGAGRGGHITVTNNSDVVTGGIRSYGVWIQSRAGIGGEGGDGFAADAGDGGPPAEGGNVIATNNGSIVTTRDGAIGVYVQSLGGAGGNGGDSYGIVGNGGDASEGGNGGSVNLTNNNTVTTSGVAAHGIAAQSIGGSGGDAGDSGSLITGMGGSGDTGGEGSTVTVTNNRGGTIRTAGNGAFAILAQSIGGGGGNGGTGGGIVGVGGSGSGGGSGGNVEVGNYADLSTQGFGAHAIVAQSIGGGGGTGGTGAGLVGIGGSVSASGIGREVKVYNYSTGNTRPEIVTTGIWAHGILAQSIGGGGGAGAASASAVDLGGAGGAAGDGGHVLIDSNANILVTGALSHGIVGQSIGGGGGSASGSSTLVSLGGQGGAAGDGKQVDVTNNGNIFARGLGGSGIFAQSIGGGGGDGSSGGGLVALGGGGNSGGAGGVVNVTNNGSITADGVRGRGILAESIGGGGGTGGDAGGLFTIGGNGSSTSAADMVHVTNNGTITTRGNLGNAIEASSIGGGGGSGGSSGGVFLTIGGAGGTGGAGGQLIIDNNRDLVTTGDDANGIFAQSVGGGGGNGGNSTSLSEFGGAAVGGSGAGGGTANSVTLNATDLTTSVGGVPVALRPFIHTSGDRSKGILAQSVGGGGGNGGFAVQLSVGFSAAASASVGGSGGGGGDGNDVYINGNTTIVTDGQDSDAIVAQSIGGGGGNGGFAVSFGGSVGIAGAAFAVGVGGRGGEAGNGQLVQMRAGGDIVTNGSQSDGIVAQSIGGGGGNGGFSVALSAAGAGTAAGAASVAVGGDGGDGGDAGKVDAEYTGNITTHGDNSFGAVLQGIGGGGGNGGFTVSGAVSGAGGGAAAAAVGIGGSGANGGRGGEVISTLTGTVHTTGDRSTGLLAQSVGGRGGNGGFNVSGSIAGAGSAAGAVSVGVGGAGGGGGDGNTVDLTLIGDALTEGTDADAFIAQSIGGSGGNGGFNVSGSVAGSGGVSGAVSVGIGGSGGAAGDGKRVDAEVRGDIVTLGMGSNAFLAQSVGGGGGNGGMNVTGSLSGSGSTSGAVAVGIGGSGGGGGDGDIVDATLNGSARTVGDNATAVIAQSLGGGGGNGGFNVTAGVSASGGASGAVSVGIGGSGANGGIGQLTTLEVDGDVVTEGRNSGGILAQSVGGGGGNGGMTVTGGLSAAGSTSGAVAVGVGGSGAAGGNGGEVSAGITGNVSTLGLQSTAVTVQSIGGGGGNGGANIVGTFNAAGGSGGAVSVGVGSSGGGAGNSMRAAGEVTGSIYTAGTGSSGLFVQSVGGGGGSGGLNVVGAFSGTGAAGGAVAVGVGGSGGGGGRGNEARATLTGSVTTLGSNAAGVVAQSLGGGGGNGSTNITGVVTAGGTDAGAVAVGIGGSGGAAGDGDLAWLRVTGDVATGGNNSGGVLAQSVGGGGGNGGMNVVGAVTLAGGSGAAIGVGVGGSGSGGGLAGQVDAVVTGNVHTTGSRSVGVTAQSIGGGGGNGGMNVTGTISATGSSGASIAVGVGSSGGGAGDGKRVDATVQNGLVHTEGNDSHGVLVQSVGGGGGSGGLNVTGSIAGSAANGGSIAVGVGGSGGGGGGGGTVDGDVLADVLTEGDDAFGVLMQSVGGGGGNGAMNITGALGLTNGGAGAVAVGLGGSGASAGDALDVDATVNGRIETHGDRSIGVLAQSVGGGGGNGGMNVAAGMTLTKETGGAIAVGSGGFAGGGGDGDIVTLNRTGDTTTYGSNAHGVIAQSLGGGGGNGGMNVSAAVAISGKGNAVAVSAGLGGFGGGGGDARDVTATVIGDVIATGHDAVTYAPNADNIMQRVIANGSNGVFAQSAGGGGGSGGINISGGIAYDNTNNGTSHSLTLGVGGFGGSGGNAGAVTLDVTAARVQSVGDDRFGIGAQSVGGGGGAGGMNISGGIAMDGVITAGIGGNGGDGGTAGAVNASAITDISAQGANAIGFFAQSLGGAGGYGAINISGGIQGSKTTSKPSLVFGLGGSGGAGNISSTVDATQIGDVTVQGRNSIGVLAQSVAGGGGAGALNVSGNLASGKGYNASVGIGGSGGFGADANTVKLFSDGDIFVDGREASVGAGDPDPEHPEFVNFRERSSGVLVQAIGGGGGTGGMNLTGMEGVRGNTLTAGVGGTGGGGGDGGEVYVERGQIQAGLIRTFGNQGSGLVAQSIGGGGGNAGVNMMESATSDQGKAINIGVGGSGGAPGHGKIVDVLHTGDIVTEGNRSYGLLAQSVGGGGGSADYNLSENDGEGSALNIGIGGETGPGGNGGEVLVKHTGNIATQGGSSVAIFAQSVGGGGGSAGTDIINSSDAKKTLTIQMGRKGGTGGDGNHVKVDSDGQLTTSGDRASAIFAQSVGSGGGESSSNSIAVGHEGKDEGSDKEASLEVGIDGALGGKSGIVEVFAEGDLYTTGLQSHGIFAQSVGGGGGDGGSIERQPAAMASHQVAVGVGGSGGRGGTSGAVSVDSGAGIETEGDRAHGIFAQSVGGGGGTGGYSATVDLKPDSKGPVSENYTVNVGGKGGEGSWSNTVDVINRGIIITHGRESHGIDAESTGGGGGAGGAVLSFGISSDETARSLAVNVGGEGGDGGYSQKVTVLNQGSIETHGDNSVGVRARSIGGKGGDGGLLLNLGAVLATANQSVTRLSMNIGGDGAIGGISGDVEVTNEARDGVEETGVIITHGRESHGIFAQSIGGGGGNGSSVISSTIGASLGGQVTVADLALGGRGGDGSQAGNVTVTNESIIDTEGEEAHGVFAQSIGGGGGNGGLALAANALLAAGDPATEGLITLGGAGGQGDDAGDVTVTNSGSIVTRGLRSHGILAQSIGGGGGNAGVGFGASLNPGTMAVAGVMSAAFGGDGGDGGRGGLVTVNHSGDITVLGTGSHAIMAESINGGGGNVALDLNGVATLPGVPQEVYDRFPLPSGIEETASLVFFGGGKNVGDSNAGNVTLNVTGTFGVAGDNGAANSVQAVGGGGGTYDLRLGLADVAGTADDVTIQGRLGGTDGTNNRGGDIESEHTGDLVTEGDNTPGAIVQSIGGGGGRANLDVSSQFGSLGATSLSLGGEGGNNEEGGNVEHEQTGSANTEGDAAHGGVYQSVGGGGGSVSLMVDGAATGPASLQGKLEDGTGHGNVHGISPTASTPEISLGSQGGALLKGGQLLLTLGGGVQTQGDHALGLVFQSVGAGGGVANLLGVGALDVTLGGAAGASGDGGNLAVTNTGNVITAGLRSHGVFLQTLGGGGGAVFTSAQDANVVLSANNTGSGGNLSFTQNGSIATQGAQSYAVFAQSVGGGGGFVDQVFAGSAGGAGGAGTIDLALNGDVLALGDDSTALFAQSAGANGLGGNITVSLAEDKQLIGGTGGTAVYFDGGAANRFTNRGTVRTLSGVEGLAFRGGAGGDFFDNFGAFLGNLDLGGGANGFANNAGAVLYSGTFFNLGDPSNVLVNNGLLSPGGPDLPVHTRLAGSYEQTALGSSDMEVEFRIGETAFDRVTASGTVRVGGDINVGLLNTQFIRAGYQFQPLFIALGGVTDTGAALHAPSSVVVTNYGLRQQSRNVFGVEYTVDFAADGLEGNRLEVGRYFNRMQTFGGPGALGDTVIRAVAETDLDVYGAILTQLGAEFYAEQQALALNGVQRFARNLQNCGTTVTGDTVGDEGGCVWARYDNNPSSRDSRAGFPAAEDESFSVSAGYQVAADGGWTFGAAFDVEDHRGQGYDGLWSVESKFIQVGANARREYRGGSFGATLDFGNSKQDVTRVLGVTDLVTAEGGQDVWLLSSVLDYTWSLSSGGFTFQPSLNLGTSVLWRDSMAERGAGAQGTVIYDGHETNLWVEPAVGLRYEAGFGSGATLRTFARLGYLQYISGTSTEVEAGLIGAPEGIAPMHIGSDLDRNHLVGEAGVQWQATGGFTLGLSYTQQESDTREGSAGSLRFAMPLK